MLDAGCSKRRASIPYFLYHLKWFTTYTTAQQKFMNEYTRPLYVFVSSHHARTPPGQGKAGIVFGQLHSPPHDLSS